MQFLIVGGLPGYRMLRYGAPQTSAPRDRTLEELDKAIAATEATAKKADTLVKGKLARAGAAEKRKTKLIAVLNSVCDECAIIPCLLPAAGKPSAACVVCGNSIDLVNVQIPALALAVRPEVSNLQSLHQQHRSWGESWPLTLGRRWTIAGGKELLEWGRR